MIAGGYYVMAVSLFIIALVFVVLYCIELNDSKHYKMLMKNYSKMVTQSMEKMEVLVDLSDSLQEENCELKDNEEYLNDYIDEQEEKISEKEKRIAELEKANDELCKQVRRLLFDANPVTEEK